MKDAVVINNIPIPFCKWLKKKLPTFCKYGVSYGIWVHRWYRAWLFIPWRVDIANLGKVSSIKDIINVRLESDATLKDYEWIKTWIRRYEKDTGMSVKLHGYVTREIPSTQKPKKEKDLDTILFDAEI